VRTVAPRMITAATALALALTACSASSDQALDEATTNPGIDVGESNGEGGDGGDASGTRPADQAFSTEQRVDMLLGSTQQQVENVTIEFGWNVRVGRIDDESFALTEDYVIDRMTLELDTDADGKTVVTRVIVELDGGPQTFDA
jgi:hypothetical protein